MAKPASTRKRKSPAKKTPAKSKEIVKPEEIEKRAKLAAIERDLKALARDVNSKIERAGKSYERGDDLLAEAAKSLAGMKLTCEAQKISFKQFCNENIKKGYTNAVRLANIGASEDPAQALQDLRERTRERVQKHREQKAKALPNPLSSGTKKPVDRSNFDDALDKVRALGGPGQRNVVAKLLEEENKVAVTLDEARAIKKSKSGPGVNDAKQMWGALKVADKKEYVKFILDQIDVKLEDIDEILDELEAKEAEAKAA